MLQALGGPNIDHCASIVGIIGRWIVGSIDRWALTSLNSLRSVNKHAHFVPRKLGHGGGYYVYVFVEGGIVSGYRGLIWGYRGLI